MDLSIISNITGFLGGGWVSVALAAILVVFAIWWAIKKHLILRDAAIKKTIEDRNSTEQKEGKETSAHDSTDASGRDASDSFLGDSKDK